MNTTEPVQECPLHDLRMLPRYERGKQRTWYCAVCESEQKEKDSAEYEEECKPFRARAALGEYDELRTVTGGDVDLTEDGAWVQAWVFVPNVSTPPETLPEAPAK